MSRKTRREAYARILKEIVEQARADPLSFSRDLKRFHFLKTIVLIGVMFWLSLGILDQVVLDKSGVVLPWLSAHAGYSSIAAIAMGVLLYALRRLARYYYGVAETSFALALIYVSVAQLQTSGTYGAFALGSAVYVLVRGIDNLVESYEWAKLLASSESQV